MTSKEANNILAILKAAYPAGYQKVTEPDLIVTVKLWAKTFKDWKYSDVENAVGAIIATRKSDFPPSPGSVMDQLIKNTTPPEMTEMEAWELAFKAIKNSSWHAEAEFKKLPEIIQRSVGSPEMLRSWAGMDAETVNSVIQSNFMRAFRSRKEQDREYLALPEEVKNKILALSEGIGA
jgi:hypothetical protein